MCKETPIQSASYAESLLKRSSGMSERAQFKEADLLPIRIQNS